MGYERESSNRNWLMFKPKFGTHISACAVTLSARAAQKFRHCRARPTAALAGGEALAIQMIGDGLG